MPEINRVEIELESKLEIPIANYRNIESNTNYTGSNYTSCVVTMPDGNILRFSDPKDENYPDVER